MQSSKFNSLFQPDQCGPASVATWAAPCARRFANDDSGNVAMLFGLCAIALIACVGGAVDYGRWLNARSQTQYALDSATLVAGRELQLTGDSAKARTAANLYYNQMKSKLVVNDTIDFVAKNNNTVVESHGGAYVQTPFLNVIGIDRLTVIADAATPTTVCIGPTCPRADGSGSGNSGTSIEISMMLDTTGSMCNLSHGTYQQPCTSATKLDAMKTAAKELIDIVVWDDQSEYTSKIAIVPFSDSVNVGSYFHAVTGQGTSSGAAQNATGQYSYPDSCYTSSMSGGRNPHPVLTLMASCRNQPQYATYYNVAPCVIERAGANEFTAVAPVGIGIAPANSTKTPEWSNIRNAVCHESTAIVPLTKDKAVLKAAINGLQAANGTAGALGTAWAWYMLAPEWGTIFSGTSAPDSYSKIHELGDTGQPKLRKIAILMTDGAYNTWQSSSGTDNSDFALGVQTKARTLCQNMKDASILVYTIGFQLNGQQNAIDTLTDCASSHTIDTGASVKYFYKADTPTSLQAAFRDIALQISKLRLSH
jgi:Flp pilus assembly protein TadG